MGIIVARNIQQSDRVDLSFDGEVRINVVGVKSYGSILGYLLTVLGYATKTSTGDFINRRSFFKHLAEAICKENDPNEKKDNITISRMAKNIENDYRMNNADSVEKITVRIFKDYIYSECLLKNQSPEQELPEIKVDHNQDLQNLIEKHKRESKMLSEKLKIEEEQNDEKHRKKMDELNEERFKIDQKHLLFKQKLKDELELKKKSHEENMQKLKDELRQK